MNIINRIKQRREDKKQDNELADTIIKSMREEYNFWSIDIYRANFGGLSIWISNSPYADMKINDRRLPKRGELRKALAYCLMKKQRKVLDEQSK